MEKSTEEILFYLTIVMVLCWFIASLAWLCSTFGIISGLFIVAGFCLFSIIIIYSYHKYFKKPKQ